MFAFCHWRLTSVRVVWVTVRFHWTSPTQRFTALRHYSCFICIVRQMSFIHVYASFNAVRISSWHWQMPSMSWVMDFIWQVHYNFNDDDDMLTRTPLMMDGVEHTWNCTNRRFIWVLSSAKSALFVCPLSIRMRCLTEKKCVRLKAIQLIGLFSHSIVGFNEIRAIWNGIFSMEKQGICHLQLRLIETKRVNISEF